MIFLTLWLLATVEAATPAAEVKPRAVGDACIACKSSDVSGVGHFSGEDWASLRAGHILKARGERRAGSTGSVSSSNRATGLIPHPPELVWDVLTDFESWPGFMPHISATQITQSRGQSLWVRQQYSILFAGFEHTTVYKLDPARGELHWSLDLTRPHDIKSSEGRWELYGAEGGQATLVRYIASMESGRSVPQLVEEMLVTKSLEQLFEGLRGEIERRSSRRILRVQRPL